MSDIAAFFAPTALPAAAGAVAFAPKTQEVSNEFAGLLAEFQAALTQQPGAQIGFTGAPSVNSSAASLLVQEGTSANPQATVETLLASGGQDQVANPDATLVAQLAALQNTLHALQVEAPATSEQTAAAPAVQSNVLGLRGTIEPAAPAQAPQETKVDAATAQPNPADKAVSPELLAVLNNQKPVQSHAKTAAKVPATTQSTADGMSHGQSTALAHAATPAQDTLNNNAFGSNAQGGTHTTGAAPQSAQPGTPAPTANPQAFAAAIAATQPKPVETPNIVLSTTPPAPAAVPLDALAVNIARKFEAGVSNFDITLHPAELGKLEISLSVADDGRIHAALRAERPETLDLLQRDARQLETQLRQAGLDVGSNSLNFSLSQGNGQRQQHPFVGWPAFADAQAAAGAAKEQALTAYVTARDRDGVDIRV